MAKCEQNYLPDFSGINCTNQMMAGYQVDIQAGQDFSKAQGKVAPPEWQTW